MATSEAWLRSLGTNPLSTLRAAHGKATSRVLAGLTGRTMGTVARWLRTGTVPAARANRLAGLAAAAALTELQEIDLGSASVEYDGRDQGTRQIGVFSIGDDLGLDVRAVVDALTEDPPDWAGAAAEFDKQVLDVYGDLGDTLTITDYTGLAS
jgi:hypothetical protein